DGIGASFRHDGFLNVVEFNILQEKCGGIGTVQRGQGARWDIGSHGVNKDK
ncbi:hypothetical protein KXW79_004287, partial [Aspergillus fumigatus]